MLRIIRNFKNRFLREGSFGTNVLTLMTGTTIAQAIPLAAAPFMTRTYSPEDFGIFALYISICAIISIISTGRYELAMMLQEKDEDAMNLAALSMGINLSISLAVLFIIWFLNDYVMVNYGAYKISRWIYFIPISVLLAGLYNVAYYWFNRKKKYKELATSRLIQSFGSVSIQLTLGFVGFGTTGLILGSLAGDFFIVGFLGWLILKENKQNRGGFDLDRIKCLMIRFKNFPKYSCTADLLNVITNQSPVLFLNSYFGAYMVGLYNLSQRVLGTPVTLISRSIFDVFKERASSDYVKYGSSKEIYLKTLKSLCLISVIPFLLFFLIAPFLFSLVFGEQWRIAGEYARILSVMYLFRFITSPLSYMYYIAEKQKEDFITHIYMGVSTLLCLFGGYYLFKDFLHILILFSINYALIYIWYLVRSYSFATGKANIKNEYSSITTTS